MQNSRRSKDLAQPVAPIGHDPGQLGHPARIGARRSANENLGLRRQDVARLDEVFRPGHRPHIAIKRAQMRGHFCRLPQARRRAGPHHHRAFGQAQGGVLDKKAVRKGLKRGQFHHNRPGGFQRRDVIGVMGAHLRQIGRAGVDRAQAMNGRGGGLAGDGMGEAVRAHVGAFKSLPAQSITHQTKKPARRLVFRTACDGKDGGRSWNRTRHESPRRSYSPLPHLVAYRPLAA